MCEPNPGPASARNACRPADQAERQLEIAKGVASLDPGHVPGSDGYTIVLAPDP